MALLLAGCGGGDNNAMPDTGGSTAISSGSSTRTLGVNSYLWHATLDTLSFIPLASADPFGGVIITEWYSAPEAPNERMKVTVYILDRALRADGLKVAVFRQTKDATGVWADAPVASTGPVVATSAAPAKIVASATRRRAAGPRARRLTAGAGRA